MPSSSSAGHVRRAELRADCGSCFGLCCVALAFTRSADFPIDKAAGDPCRHLDEHDACRIHADLRPRGFKGCAVFDCFGAGQKVSQQTFAGRSWREDPGVRSEMFAAFPVVRRLHELLWYLDKALGLPGAPREALLAHAERVRAATDQPAEQLAQIDVDAEFDLARPLLVEASRAARAGRSTRPGADGPRLGPGQDLAGADLSGTDLRGAELRGSLLIGADLSGADLSWCDVLGADVRDVNLAGARLGDAIYLTQMQVNSARGDLATQLPTDLERPSHWVATTASPAPSRHGSRPPDR